ncbi:MAG: bifunctional riboflavin kinase/FMN adenylyltransferase [Candidatus Cloacimonadota bacterium]|nr:MAG: bifunctional riboflavin kinase/FMN adenylyltransferase [Candidatus Cloacimonadota bacterium]PIE77435.1 MAG: bifunctional riboflavin kinase/FMN adenylyltransferase [Candidatus Delongbacteria bacterium]
MKICTLKDIDKPLTITLGSFDGIHLGHIDLIDHLKRKADETGSKSAIITFKPHPREVVNPDYDIRYITTWSEKIELLERTGIDFLIVQEFNREIMKTDPTVFIRDYILANVEVKHFVSGFNHHFGKDRKGGFLDLEKLGKEFSFNVSSVPPRMLNNKPISSTIIRQSVLSWDGNVDSYLGRFFFIDGVVVHGKKRGRTINFPTINLLPENPKKMRPEVGVYFTAVKLDGVFYFSMTNIGYNPTFEEGKKTIESYILNYNDYCYDKKLRLYFILRLRDEIKFDGIESLTDQLIIDKNRAINLTKGINFEDPRFI